MSDKKTGRRLGRMLTPLEWGIVVLVVEICIAILL